MERKCMTTEGGPGASENASAFIGADVPGLSRATEEFSPQVASQRAFDCEG